jgi:hypothetical protein
MSETVTEKVTEKIVEYSIKLGKVLVKTAVVAAIGGGVYEGWNSYQRNSSTIQILRDTSRGAVDNGLIGLTLPVSGPYLVYNKYTKQVNADISEFKPEN